MDPLASPLDVQERLGRDFTAEESLRVEALIRDASSKVRQVSSQFFTLETTTVTLALSPNGEVRLGQRPVVDVVSVEDKDGNTLTYRQVNDRLIVNPLPLNIWELHWPVGHCVTGVTVEYEHGGTVPDDIIAVVCNMVGRALGSDLSASGVFQTSIDGYSESTSVTLGTHLAQGSISMLASEREICEAYRFPSVPIPT